MFELPMGAARCTGMPSVVFERGLAQGWGFRAPRDRAARRSWRDAWAGPSRGDRRTVRLRGCSVLGESGFTV